MVRDGVISSLGKAIKAMRIHQGWSQKEFARRAGVHYQTVANVENGYVRSSYKADQMCRALGTTLAKLTRSVAEAQAGIAPLRIVPDVGDLTRALMEHRGVDDAELAVLMRVEADDVADLMDGSCGPQLWGAAAVALQVAPEVYDIAVNEGVEAALRSIGLGTFLGPDTAQLGGG